jgi:hypothetical protein
MGTINYGYNKYFNMGMNLSLDYDEYDYIGEFNYLIEETQETLKKYTFDYFKIDIEYGYYEGFYIDIDFDYLWVDYYEKALILKELTQLKKLLFELCYIGLVRYSPGWCMTYYTEEETKTAIKKAIRETKEEMKHFPTYKKYREGVNA